MSSDIQVRRIRGWFDVVDRRKDRCLSYPMKLRASAEAFKRGYLKALFDKEVEINQ